MAKHVHETQSNIEGYSFFYPFIKFSGDDYAVFTPYNFENRDMQEDLIVNDADDCLIHNRFRADVDIIDAVDKMYIRSYADYMVEGYDENGHLCMVSISDKSLTDAEAGFYDQCMRGWHREFGLHTPYYMVAYKYDHLNQCYRVVETELHDEYDIIDMFDVMPLTASRYENAGINTRYAVQQFMQDIREAKKEFLDDHNIYYESVPAISWRYCLDLLDVSEDDFYKPTPWEAYI